MCSKMFDYNEKQIYNLKWEEPQSLLVRISESRDDLNQIHVASNSNLDSNT